MRDDCVDIVAGFKLGDGKCRNDVSGAQKAQEMGSVQWVGEDSKIRRKCLLTRIGLGGHSRI